MATPTDLVTSALTRWRKQSDRSDSPQSAVASEAESHFLSRNRAPRFASNLRTFADGGKKLVVLFSAGTCESGEEERRRQAAAAGAVRNELLTSEPDRAVLLKILTNLHRRALADYRERGLHILHVALGILEWRDEEEVFRAPILLVPVKLERHSLKDPFQLAAVEEDPIINPALTARLKQDFDFYLPAAPDDWAEKKPAEYLDAIKAAIAGLPGWEVQPSVILTLFSFFKGVIFQDLQENMAQVMEHKIVQTLAGAPASSMKMERLDEKGLDERQDPQTTFHILDADGSQRLCLEAAARGESFVLIGPPGTGKSQTIANLIADQIAHGKKVLFVSEKMAALEVVYKRLCAVGLGEFCLELHSHKANKREVIKELARCHQEKLPPQPTPSAEDFAAGNSGAISSIAT